MSEENIEKGCINSDRTRCRCDCCEEEMDLDPSWTHESKCPLCEERLVVVLTNPLFPTNPVLNVERHTKNKKRKI